MIKNTAATTQDISPTACVRGLSSSNNTAAAVAAAVAAAAAAAAAGAVAV